MNLCSVALCCCIGQIRHNCSAWSRIKNYLPDPADTAQSVLGHQFFTKQIASISSSSSSYQVSASNRSAYRAIEKFSKSCCVFGGAPTRRNTSRSACVRIYFLRRGYLRLCLILRMLQVRIHCFFPDIFSAQEQH